MGFEVGTVPFNPNVWGPPESPSVPLLSRRDGVVQSRLSSIPFAPFSRSEKVGRIADWARNNAGGNPKSSSGAAVFDFALLDEDANAFRLVDGKPPPRPKFGPQRRFQQRPQRKDEEVEAKKRGEVRIYEVPADV